MLQTLNAGYDPNKCGYIDNGGHIEYMRYVFV